MPKETLDQLGLHVGIWRWEVQTGAVTLSPYLMHLLGFDAAATTQPSTQLREMVHPDDLADVQADMARYLGGEGPFERRFKVRHGAGSYIDLQCRGGLIDWPGGAATQGEGVFIGIAVDVTAEETYRRNLEASQKTLADVAQSLPGALIGFTWNADGTDRIDFISSGSTDIWGESPDDIMVGPEMLRQFVDDADLPRLDAAFAEARRNPAPIRERWKIRLPFGVVKFLEMRARPSRISASGISWSGVILDVTAEEQVKLSLHRTTAMLVQSQKMEAIGRIAGGVAHDFNNLLAVVMGNAELVALDGPDDPNSQSVDEIVAACVRGADLTRRLLGFARQATLSPRVLNLNDIVMSMNAMMRRTIPESITVETSLLAGLWNTLADGSFIERSLLNLVINARDAMPAGGRLTIETSNMRVTREYAEDRAENIPPGRYVMLAVTDTGTGIPKDVVDKVVEPFFSTKGPQMGSGLGLAVVDGFVRQSGGFLRIYSEVGRGTTVKIYLRASAEAVAGAGDERMLQVDTGEMFRARLLLVEDEPAVRRYLVRVLRGAGFEVIEATSGEQGLERFQDLEGEIDLLLSDVVVPGAIQGPELASRLVALKPGLPVVFMSGYPSEAAVNGNHLRATDRFLMKPVQRADLLRALADALAPSG